MGKSCIRFKTLDDVPLDVVGALFRRVSAAKYIEQYETVLKGAVSRKPVAKKTPAKKAKAK